ncbi:MAG TPA: FeoB-associated Cys-rich membrane protein [Puia sp.]|nr:FeoB-associated Cys-rich membrane protein [Puia sp.]
MSIDTNQLVFAIIIAVLLAGTLAYVFWKQRKDTKKGVKKDSRGEGAGEGSAAGPSIRQLQLQAYERLILLTDRIALPNLISRVNQQGLSAREMQSLLTQSVKQEFEHNITQQIYVTAEAWDAVRNLKEQNLLIINQVSSFLPPEATGMELNKSLLELLMQSPKASLQNIVSEALAYEAKKLM